MTNKEVARLLRNVAAVYTLKGENRFRIIAYEKAIETIEKSSVEVEDLWKEDKLQTLPGIGSSLASHLSSLFKTGKVKHFESVFKGIPQTMFPLLDVPGFGPKKTFKLVTILKLKNPKTVIDDLLKVAKQGKIAKIGGFGTKSQEDIINALERFKKGQGKAVRMPLPIASAIALEVIEYLQKCPQTINVYPLGSLRRQVSTIGDIDLAVSSNNPEEVLAWFINYPKKTDLVEKGPAGATILVSGGRHIDLRVQAPNTFGAMLQYFTGSKQHNIHLREISLKQGLSLSEYGIKPINKSQFQISKFKTNSKSKINFNKQKKLFEFEKEEEFYKFLGLSWIPPELREDNGEIEEAQKNILPKLIEKKDIRGEFHIHTSYNLQPSHDLGVSDLKEILLKADDLGYEYVGISDHNPKQTGLSNNEIIYIMKRRKEYYEQILSSSKSVRVKLFIMLEIDILPDGNLALPEEAFEYIDAAIVSIHSSFQMPKKEMTDRILKGLLNPKAKILGHPTGRLIGKREGYEVDWERLFKYCLEKNKAIEINAYPDRLDLPDLLVKEAIKRDVKLTIDTDSHDVKQMDLIGFGVSVARRGWVETKDIINTMEYNRVKSWLLNY